MLRTALEQAELRGLSRQETLEVLARAQAGLAPAAGVAAAGSSGAAESEALDADLATPLPEPDSLVDDNWNIDQRGLDRAMLRLLAMVAVSGAHSWRQRDAC